MITGFTLKIIGLVSMAMLLITSAATNNEFVSFNQSMRLTPEANAYSLVADGSQITVVSNGSGQNNREIYWDKDSPDSSSATQCAVWTSGVGGAQSGMVFRIAEEAGGYNAVVFARNVYMGWYWVFAPKIFHTGAGYDEVWDSPPGVDLSAYLGASQEAAVYPLRVCASLSSDDVLSFAVAKGFDPMPPLNGDLGTQGGTWKLDMSSFYHEGHGLVGKNGIFAGHVPSGTSLVFDDVHITNLSTD